MTIISLQIAIDNSLVDRLNNIKMDSNNFLENNFPDEQFVGTPITDGCGIDTTA